MTVIVSFYKIIRAFIHKMKDDYVSAFSAQVAFYVLISFFPFIMFLLTMIQYLPFTQETIIKNVSAVLPSSIRPMIVSVIHEVFDKASGTVLSIAVISALWTSSKGILSVLKGLNAIYGIKESRNFIHVRFISTLYTFIFAIIMLITLCFLVFGNQLYLWIESKFPLLQELAFLIISIRTAVGLLILTLFFLLIYSIIPNHHTAFYKQLPGAMLSAVGWMGFSYLYSFYIDTLSNSSNMYGSLTAIVLFMLWFYFCMYILFIGAELNVVLSSGDLIYYLRYLIKHRKTLNKKKVSLSYTSLSYQEDSSDPLHRVIDKSFQNKKKKK